MTTYTSDTNKSMLLPQLYRLSSSRALVAPANVKAAAEGQTVTVTWDVVSGAKDYTVTCTGQTEQTVSGTSCSFENLEYDTEYTVSVVANPEDASVSKSAASTATVKTGENPNPYLTVTPSEYKDEIPAAGAVLNFTVKTNQPSWTVTSTDETNFKPSVLSDNSGFTVTVAANDGDARTATITVIAENLNQTISLNQAAYKATETKVATLSITKSVTSQGTLTDDKGNAWTFTTDGSLNGNTSYIKAGTNSGKVSYIRFKSSYYSNAKIVKIQLWGTAKANTSVSPKVMIGTFTIGTGSIYTSQNADNGGTEFSVENTSGVKGEVTLEISRPSLTTGAIYFNKAIITYEE